MRSDFLPDHIGICSDYSLKPRQASAESTAVQQADSQPVEKTGTAEAKPLSHVKPGFVPRLRGI